MDVVIGFVVGYLVSKRLGRLNFEEIGEAWEKIKNSEEAQDFLAGSVDLGFQMYHYWSQRVTESFLALSARNKKRR